MRRREFIALVAAATACPLSAHAQQSGPPRKVGMLMNSSESDPEWQAHIATFRQRLRGLGWVEGRNVRIDVRYSVGDPDHARVSATELIHLAPDVIFSSS